MPRSSTSDSATRRSFPRRRSRRPATSSPATRSSRAYERIFSLHVSARVSGTFASAEAAAAELGHGIVRAIDTETASASIAMLALAIQRRLERGTSDEEIDALVERYRRERGLLFTVDTLEFLQRGGRIGKAAAFAGTLLHVKPILSIRDGEVEPVKRVRGERKAFAELAEALETETRTNRLPARGRARSGAGAGGRARGARARAAARGRARARRHARRGDRRARRPGNARALLVPRRRLTSGPRGILRRARCRGR